MNGGPAPMVRARPWLRGAALLCCSLLCVPLQPAGAET
jgi:hypothetical protein